MSRRLGAQRRNYITRAPLSSSVRSAPNGATRAVAGWRCIGPTYRPTDRPRRQVRCSAVASILTLRLRPTDFSSADVRESFITS